MHADLCQLKHTVSPPPPSNVQRVCERAPSWYIHLICAQSEQTLKPIKTGDEGLLVLHSVVCVCVCPAAHVERIWRGDSPVVEPGHVEANSVKLLSYIQCNLGFTRA